MIYNVGAVVAIWGPFQ